MTTTTTAASPADRPEPPTPGAALAAPCTTCGTTSRKMSPGTARDDVAHRRLLQSKLAAQRGRARTRRGPLAYSAHLLLGRLGAMPVRAARVATRHSATPMGIATLAGFGVGVVAAALAGRMASFRSAIRRVVGGRPQEEMGRTDAASVIATMAHLQASRYRPVADLVGEAMGESGATVHVELPVPGRLDTAEPRPAGVGVVNALDLGPEAISEGHGRLCGHGHPPSDCATPRDGRTSPRLSDAPIIPPGRQIRHCACGAIGDSDAVYLLGRCPDCYARIGVLAPTLRPDPTAPALTVAPPVPVVRWQTATWTRRPHDPVAAALHDRESADRAAA